MTPYEIARRAVAPFMPALEGEVAALLAEAVPTGATLLDVGGRKSPYTIGLPVSVTVSELPRESEHQHLHNLGLDDAGVAAIRRTRSNVADVVFDDMSCSTLGTASFDAAVAVEVIEHVDDDGFVRNLARVVRPGGPVVLTTPNGDARPVHGADHRRHYRRDQLIKLVVPYFDVVFVRYAVAMTDNRLVGMRSFSPHRPLDAFEVIRANVRSRSESADPDVRRNRGAAANLVALLRAKSPEAVEAAAAAKVSNAEPVPSGGAARWARRSEWVHRVVMGDAMLAAPGGERRTLQGLAAAIWVVLEEPLTVEELTEELRDLADGVQLAPHAIDEALRLMEDHGVLEYVSWQNRCLSGGSDIQTLSEAARYLLQ